jgi:putative SOS response-associated peptidase YedK
MREKPGWRRAFRRHQVVLPAGFYGWQPVEVDAKLRQQPFQVDPADGRGILPMAGLYKSWPDLDKAEGEPDRWLWTTVVAVHGGGAAGPGSPPERGGRPPSW